MLSKSFVKRIQQRWASIQAKGNRVDFERGKLLHEVWLAHHKDEKTLAGFIVTELGEFPGKCAASLARLAPAFDAEQDEEIWRKIGGQGVVLLSRVKSEKHRKSIMRLVNSTTKNTGRDSVSIGTFRTFVQTVLGPDYKDVLLEHRSEGISLKVQLIALKRCIFALLQKHPELRRELPAPVRAYLKLDGRRRRVVA